MCLLAGGVAAHLAKLSGTCRGTEIARSTTSRLSSRAAIGEVKGIGADRRPARDPGALRFPARCAGDADQQHRDPGLGARVMFVLMYAFDLSLNIMSLGGIALAVGMLVDNAVVVLEAIVRNQEHGMERRGPRAAARRKWRWR